MSRDPDTSDTYVNCCFVNLGFMGVRVGLRLYWYLRLLGNPHLQEVSFCFFLGYSLSATVWSFFIIYANYLFFRSDDLKDSSIVIALLLIITFGYIVVMDTIVFLFFITRVLIFIAAYEAAVPDNLKEVFPRFP